MMLSGMILFTIEVSPEKQRNSHFVSMLSFNDSYTDEEEEDDSDHYYHQQQHLKQQPSGAPHTLFPSLLPSDSQHDVISDVRPKHPARKGSSADEVLKLLQAQQQLPSLASNLMSIHNHDDDEDRGGTRRMSTTSHKQPFPKQARGDLELGTNHSSMIPPCHPRRQSTVTDSSIFTFAVDEGDTDPVGHAAQPPSDPIGLAHSSHHHHHPLTYSKNTHHASSSNLSLSQALDSFQSEAGDLVLSSSQKCREDYHQHHPSTVPARNAVNAYRQAGCKASTGASSPREVVDSSAVGIPASSSHHINALVRPRRKPTMTDTGVLISAMEGDLTPFLPSRKASCGHSVTRRNCNPARNNNNISNNMNDSDTNHRRMMISAVSASPGGKTNTKGGFGTGEGATGGDDVLGRGRRSSDTTSGGMSALGYESDLQPFLPSRKASCANMG